ncbi:MAG: TetR/AcrR family transcriptional regulator [Micromonosporaceae bacterium]|nr:TetR/AcrR family transcriptional regulator [Micromonosporaceae bacterium]
MPRVSEAHRAARRQQILDAARACFTRRGFHATTMQDVIAEAGLSVGAVYRYFKGKDELIEAIANGYVERLRAQIMPLIEVDLPLEESMRATVEFLDEVAIGEDGPLRLALQVWAEAVRDERLGAMVQRVYSGFREAFVQMARRAARAGQLPERAVPEAVGAVLFSLVIGYLLQNVLTGGPDRETYLAGVRSLLAR